MSGNLIHSCERYTAPPGVTLEVLIDRLEELLTLNSRLRESGYRITKETELISAYVLPDTELFQILYCDIEGVTRDMRLLLLNAIDQSVLASLPDLEKTGTLGELGPWNEDSERSINTFDAWLNLLRERLKSYCGDSDGFFTECRQAFPDFLFSDSFPDCFGTFRGNLNDFIPEVVFALSSLANDMPECMTQPSTEASMKAFSAMSGYETSMEGNATRKEDLTFKFTIEKEDVEETFKILCEPHIKLNRAARSGNNSRYFHRIYFSSAESKHDDLKGKTLIGHIGRHL